MMSNKIPSSMAAALALFLTTAVAAAQTSSPAAQTSTSQNSTSDTTATTTSSTASGSTAGISTRDRNFIRELAYQNMAEIELAKLAQSKSKNDSVLSFANRMLTDHSKALEDLQQLALKKGVTLPSADDIANKTQLVMFKAMPVATFDKNYISKGGIRDHEKTHRLLNNINNRAQDPDLKALSASMLQVVEQHQQLAQQMSQHQSVVR